MMTTEDVLHLTAAAPFSLDQSARFLRGFAPCADGPVCAGSGADLAVRAVLEVAGRAALVTVRQDGPTAVRVTGAGLDDAVAGAVRRWLSLDDPLAEFYALADGDPELAGPVADLHGLHQVRFGSLAEGVVWFTITHRTGQGVALEWKRAIAERYGPPVRDGDAVLHAFPPLADLLAVPEAELVDLLRAPHRVARLRGVLERRYHHLRHFQTGRLESDGKRGLGAYPHLFCFITNDGKDKNIPILGIDRKRTRLVGGDSFSFSFHDNRDTS